MATVTAFIRVSTKKSDKANVRFRLRDGRKLQLFYKSNLEVNPAYWDASKQEIKAKILFDTAKRAEFNKNVANLKNLILEIYSEAKNKDVLTSEILEREIDKALNPEKYGLNEKLQSFIEVFTQFIEEKKISDVRKRNFRVINRALQRYELYNQYNGMKDYKLSFENINASTLRDIERFLSDEHKLCENYPQIYKEIPETRTPKPRGQNTLNDIFTKIRTFFLWAIDNEKTTNNPFRKFKIGECVYGTPFFLTIDELERVYNTNLSRHPKLAIQRDIFVFQSSIGCRVGDLYKFTRKDNVINGGIEYIPRKTKDGNPVTVYVSLNDYSLEILNRYKSHVGPGIFPFISEQKYNIAIKRICMAAGLKRLVTIINPTTREPEVKPLFEIASSHMARRNFSGLLKNLGIDNTIICSMTGHKTNSRAFDRYININSEMKQKVVNMLVKGGKNE